MPGHYSGMYGSGALEYDEYLYSKYLRPLQRGKRRSQGFELFPPNSTPAGSGSLLGDLGREPYAMPDHGALDFTRLLGQRRRGRPTLIGEGF